MEIQQQRKLKCIEIYGVDHYSKTAMFKINHKNQSHILPENFCKLKDPVWLTENNNKSCQQIAEMLGVTKSTVAKSFIKCNVEHKCDYTYGEEQLAQFINSIYSDEIIRRSRKIIKPKEIDIFLPDINLAIEYNGIFWHSEKNGKDELYHLDKTNRCKEQDIRLIHILDHEWENKREIVKSRLSSIIGVNETIYARKCTIKKLTRKEYLPFFENTHIQASVNSKTVYGLIYNGKIVSAMSFGPSRFNKKFQWELLRFSNELNITVVGGASKLFSYFIKMNNPISIISYCDIRWNTGKVYEHLGFNLIQQSTPNFLYTKNYVDVYSRYSCQKKKLHKILNVFDPTISGKDNLEINGYDKIWDCGNLVYGWHKT